MTDLISRQAAIDAISYSEVAFYPGDSESDVLRRDNDVKQAILDLPAAQPDIVYCGECKHTYLSDNFGITSPWLMCKGHIGNVYKVNENDFCSWGERREDGSN